MAGDLTDEQIRELSTPEERTAEETWRTYQGKSWVDETDLLIISQACSILVARNERLGLVEKKS